MVANDIDERKGPGEDTGLLSRVDLQTKCVLEVEGAKSDAEAVWQQHSASCDEEEQHVVEGIGDCTRHDKPSPTSIVTKLDPAKSSPHLLKQRTLHGLVCSVDPFDNMANLVNWHCHWHHVVEGLAIDTEGFEDSSRVRIHRYQIIEIDRILPDFARGLMQECNHDMGRTLTVFINRLVDALRNVLIIDDPPAPLPPNRQIVLQIPGHSCDGQLRGPSAWGIGINI